jgi:ubiquinone/menaquinone biosynthesis C-methylase UbiE
MFMSADQKGAFLTGEGDAWFARNETHLHGNPDDIVVQSLKRLPTRPRRILEIGASNGHRLALLRDHYGAEVHGIEPSAQAVDDARSRFPQVAMQVGTADSLPFADASFDLVIFGFCLYLVDIRDHFRAVAEADRVLASGGMLAIFDFIEPLPYFNRYAHRDGLRSHKAEWARFFLASPTYRLVQRLADLKGTAPLDRNNISGVDIIVKNVENAYPQNPF